MVCNLCPRECGINRAERSGVCGVMTGPVVSKVMVHRWEEPPISGTQGSGAVFFAGCNLRCVFCQNHKISRGGKGETVTPGRLAEIFFELAGRGVHNINLVSPGHFAPKIAEAVEIAKINGFSLPFVYNTNAYEKTETLRRLEGLIDIYLPDLKFFDSYVSLRYSGAEDYFRVASDAVSRMAVQVGSPHFTDDGTMLSGLIIRHLVLPGLRKDSMRLLDWIAERLPGRLVSLMAQYMPVHEAGKYSEINRKITAFEYDSVVKYAQKLAIPGFVQDRTAAVDDFVPDF